jgi:hypothetical protein
LLDLSGRTIREPSDLIEHWAFHIDDGISEPDLDQDVGRPLISQAIEPTDELVSLFELAITRHIKARGYPQHPQLDPLTNEEERTREADSVTIRARKLLKFASSSELLPLGPWTLVVSHFRSSFLLLLGSPICLPLF